METNEETKKTAITDSTVSLEISSVIEATGQYINVEVWAAPINTYFTISAARQLTADQKIYLFNRWADSDTAGLTREIYVEGNKEYIAYYKEA